MFGTLYVHLKFKFLILISRFSKHVIVHAASQPVTEKSYSQLYPQDS